MSVIFDIGMRLLAEHNRRKSAAIKMQRLAAPLSPSSSSAGGFYGGNESKYLSPVSISGGTVYLGVAAFGSEEASLTALQSNV